MFKRIVRFFKGVFSPLKLSTWEKRYDKYPNYIEKKLQVETVKCSEMISFETIQRYKGDIDDIHKRCFYQMSEKIMQELVNKKFIETNVSQDYEHGCTVLQMRLKVVREI